MKKVCLYIILLLTPVVANGEQKKHEWARYNRYAEVNEKLQKAPTVVFLGNSITEDWADRRPDFFESNNYAGRGISGQTSCEMLVRFQSDVVNLHPKAVAILAGTNDLAQNIGYISLEHILQNVISMCQLAKANKIIPIICSVTPCKQYSWRKELQPADSIVALNKMLKTYSIKNHIIYVDYWSALAADDNGMKAEYTTDQCHLTASGYEVMEDIILKALRKARIR